MGKSQETFNKKEKEKKRLKKRQDKLLKKEERKESSVGGGLENMMAYVDEFGQISDTPPDPTKKKVKINAEDIEIGVVKREDIIEEPKSGKVSYYNNEKGYGFIEDKMTRERYFFHVNGVLEDVDLNDKVTYELIKGTKGLNAVEVRKLVDKPKVVEKPVAEATEEVSEEADTTEGEPEAKSETTEETSKEKPEGTDSAE
jgi:cold shock CspA family protein